jgi:hypothetical protein
MREPNRRLDPVGSSLAVADSTGRRDRSIGGLRLIGEMRLDVKPKVHNICFFDDVVFAFESEEPLFLHFCF